VGEEKTQIKEIKRRTNYGVERGKKEGRISRPEEQGDGGGK